LVLFFNLIGCKIGFCQETRERYTSPDSVPCVDYLWIYAMQTDGISIFTKSIISFTKQILRKANTRKAYKHSSGYLEGSHLEDLGTRMR